MNASDASEKYCAGAKAEQDGRQTWPEYIGLEKYAVATYRLQEEADLTFREARACLTPLQCVEGLAKEWGCSKENVYNLQRSGRRKVREYTKGDEEKIKQLLPPKICHIL